MKKKLLGAVLAVVTILIITPTSTFAADGGKELLSDITCEYHSYNYDNEEDVAAEPESNTKVRDDEEIGEKAGRFTIIKKYYKTLSGTKYNSAKTKKCVYNQKIYKVYKKNIGTGKLYYQYKEDHWSWKGYKKTNGKWVYVTSKSGVSKETSGSDIYQYLGNFF